MIISIVIIIIIIIIFFLNLKLSSVLGSRGVINIINKSAELGWLTHYSAGQQSFVIIIKGKGFPYSQTKVGARSPELSPQPAGGYCRASRRLRGRSIRQSCSYLRRINHFDEFCYSFTAE